MPGGTARQIWLAAVAFSLAARQDGVLTAAEIEVDEEGVIHQRGDPVKQRVAGARVAGEQQLAAPSSEVFDSGSTCYGIAQNGQLPGPVVVMRATLGQAQWDCNRLPDGACAGVNANHHGFAAHFAAGGTVTGDGTLWLRVEGCVAEAAAVVRRGPQQVPKLLHQIWLDGGGVSTYPQPEHMMRTWSVDYVETHPDWRYRLWRDADIAAVCPPKLTALAAATRRYSCKADVLRTCILLTYGGVVMDADSISLNRRPLELAIGNASFVAAVQHGNDLIAAGWQAATAGHWAVQEQAIYYTWLAGQCATPDAVGCGSPAVPFWLRYGPGPLTDVLCGTSLTADGEAGGCVGTPGGCFAACGVLRQQLRVARPWHTAGSWQRLGLGSEHGVLLLPATVLYAWDWVAENGDGIRSQAQANAAYPDAFAADFGFSTQSDAENKTQPRAAGVQWEA